MASVGAAELLLPVPAPWIALEPLARAVPGPRVALCPETRRAALPPERTRHEVHEDEATDREERKDHDHDDEDRRVAHPSIVSPPMFSRVEVHGTVSEKRAPHSSMVQTRDVAYDLAFWAGPRTSREPSSIYMDLLNGQEVPGLRPFAISEVLNELQARFPGLRAPLGAGQANWESNPPGAVFEFSWSQQHLLATARGTFTNDQMNSIIDVCVTVGDARLYDPQTNERFDRQ